VPKVAYAITKGKVVVTLILNKEGNVLIQVILRCFCIFTVAVEKQ